MKLLLAFLFLFNTILNCYSQQFTLYATSSTPVVGQNLEVFVRANNFDSITGVSFVTTWDTAVFQYIDLSNFQLPNTTLNSSFGTTEVNKGILRFNWEDITTNGITTKDSVILFKLRLKVLKLDKDAKIDFISLPPGLILEVSRNLVPLTNLRIIPYRPFTVSVEDISFFQEIKIYPNPIKEYSVFSINSTKAININYRIYNLLGQIIESRSHQIFEGLNTIDLPQNLENNQIYFLSIDNVKTIEFTKTN